ncbi:uncharacterized protein LOC117122228 [Anneissia japonica]|uniref:uncharacterized protein LOC117122228 n=1 Tax=Anneissia japonica TaxID=1529436 RepID=UPI0014258433|nr:uncharacterized protein LOC117122228 [Anneissia japonica]
MSRAVFVLVFDLTLDLNAKAFIDLQSDHRLKNFPKWMVKVSTFLGLNRKCKVYELDMTNLDFIMYWLSSIYAHTKENIQKDGAQTRQLSPPIFFVGTHKNSLPGGKSEKNAKIKEIFDTLRKMLSEKPYEKHIVARFYAIDNSLRNDGAMQELQIHILKVVEEQPYMNEHVPAPWMAFEYALEEKRQENVQWIDMAEASELATRCKVNAAELSTLLQFQHDTGNCVHFVNTAKADDPLNFCIILNQMWLNDIFKSVITIKPPQDQLALFRSSWDKLASEGLLDEKLARHVWREYEIDPNVLFGLMSKFDLLCEMQFPPEESARRLAEETRVFCLPCCLSETIEAPLLVKDGDCTIRFFVDFAGYLPCGLFFRLMVRAICFSQECGGRSGRDQHLSRYSAKFYIDQDHHLFIRIYTKDRSFLEVMVVRVAGDGDYPSPAVCQMIREFLMAALTDICKIWSKGVTFTFGIPCDQCEAETGRLHLHTFDDCIRASRVPCQERRMATERFQRLFVKGFDHVYIQEKKNFHMIQSLVIDLGTEQMRKFFLNQIQISRGDVGRYLINEQHGKFKGVRLFADQKLKMFRIDADITSFDITIMMLLIRHCCGIVCPDKFWTNPDKQDNSELANLVRIREYRNMNLAHHPNSRIPSNEFEDEWKKLTAIFQGVGVPIDDINTYRQIAV